jgi:hypothetical protein
VAFIGGAVTFIEGAVTFIEGAVTFIGEGGLAIGGLFKIAGVRVDNVRVNKRNLR